MFLSVTPQGVIDKEIVYLILGLPAQELARCSQFFLLSKVYMHVRRYACVHAFMCICM